MTEFILSLLLIGLACLMVVLRKTYGLVPAYELKRQAQAGDPLAKTLYRVVAYGAPAQLLLWLLELLALSGGIVLIAQVVPDFLLFGCALLAITYVFVWLPRTEVTELDLRWAEWSSGPVVWLVSHLFTALDRPAARIKRRHSAEQHTGLYEREDVLRFLDRQKQQADNRLSETDLTQLVHALTYGHKKVSDVMTPRKKAKIISDNEAIGPITLGELHDSDATFFPVYDAQNPDRIVGTLNLADAVRAKQGGRIGDVMHTEVFYVNEDYTVEQLLHAFLKTKQHGLIVVNTFEEFVGVVTIEDAVRHVVGHDIANDFTQYDDLHAVAQAKHKP